MANIFGTSGIGSQYDTIQSSIIWNLTINPYVEKLVLTGANLINGTGNNLSNSIVGNDVTNVLSGLDGNDKLEGQGGNNILNGGNGAVVRGTQASNLSLTNAVQFTYV